MTEPRCETCKSGCWAEGRVPTEPCWGHLYVSEDYPGMYTHYCEGHGHYEDNDPYTPDPNKVTLSIPERITEYLTLGGFWNPEHMEHQKVSSLLIDCREYISKLQAENKSLVEQLTRTTQLAKLDDDYVIVWLDQNLAYRKKIDNG
jgi:hypothetical protein